MRPSKTAISVLILLAIGLHAVPLLHAGERKRLWPFLVWAMYKNSRPAGPIQTNIRRLVGITRRGAAEVLTAEVIGLGPPAIDRMYIRPMLDGDSTGALRLADRLNRTRVDPFVEFHLGGDKYTVTDGGIVRQENPVLIYPVDSSASRLGARP